MFRDRFTSQRTVFITTIIVVSLLLVSLFSLYIYSSQRQQLIDTKKQEMEVEADLIGGFLRDYLLRHDYTEARGLLEKWPQTHMEVVALSAELDNGKTLFSHNGDRMRSEELMVARNVAYGERQVQVRLCHSSRGLEQTLGQLAIQLIGFTALMVVTTGVMLWYVLFRWTIKPMEQEISERKRQLRVSEERFRRLTENAKDMIYRMGLPNGRYEYVSPAAKELFGYAPQEFYDNPLLIRKLLHPDWRAYFEEIWAKLVVGDMPLTYEYKIIHKSGESRWMNQRNVLVRDRFNRPVAIEAIVTDITARKEMEERLSQSMQIIESTSEAIVVTTPDGEIVDVNNAYTEIMGYEREELLGSRPSMIKSGHHDEKFYQQMWGELNEQGHWSGEIWDRRKSGELFPVWLSINAIRNGAGEVVNYVGVFSDITVQKKSEAELERLAFFDPLTGLPNRALFHERLQHEIDGARRENAAIALLFIDLDRFKWVNDTLGHAAGDELLNVVAKRLRALLRESDTVARLGGDEFTVILPGTGSTDHVSSVAQSIVNVIKEPIALSDQEVHVGASVGVAFYPDDGADLETLSKNADIAMYQAKEAGRDTFQFYSQKNNLQALRHIILDDEMHKALEREEFTLHYQPKVAAASGKMVGMEALLRWQKADGEMVSPAEFIPLAEETGLIISIGEWVLNSACRQMAAWAEEGAPGMKVAVNLSARQFRDRGLVEMVRSAIARTAIAPECLELEITESMVMGDVESAITTMKRLRALGVTLAIDDFGTGYSSLSYLKRFPINTLKIDRSFVSDLTLDSDDAAIVDAVISMATSLNLNVVAEGVESAEQLDYLRSRGCTELQGFYISRPLPADEFSKLYRMRGGDMLAEAGTA